MSIRLWLVVSSALSLLLAGCGRGPQQGNAANNNPGPAALPGLPHPAAAAARIVSSPVTKIELFGSDYAAWWNLATREEPTAVLNTKPGDSSVLKDVGWCMYAFYAAEASTLPTINVDADQDSGGRVWIAVANWDTMRWDWALADENGTAMYSDIVPLKRAADGLLLAVVAATGKPAVISRVTLGTPVLPEITLTATPLTTFVPSQITLEVSLSTLPPGQAFDIDFDLDSDGIFDENMQESMGFQFVQAQPGQHTAAVRVTVDEGVSARASTMYELTGQTAAWALGEVNGFERMQTCNDDSVMLMGQQFDHDVDRLALAFARVSRDGNLLWCHGLGSGASLQACDIVTFPDGGYAAAAIQFDGASPGRQVVVARLDDDGILMWVRLWAESRDFYPYAMASSEEGNLIIVGGLQAELDGASYIPSLFALDGENGSLLWDSAWRPDGADAVTYLYDVSVDPQGAILVSGLSSAYEMLLCKLTSDGQFLWQRGAGGASQGIDNSLAVDFQSNIYVTYQSSAAQAAVFCKLDSSGNVLWGRAGTGGVIVLDASGCPVVSGESIRFYTTNGLLLSQLLLDRNVRVDFLSDGTLCMVPHFLDDHYFKTENSPDQPVAPSVAPVAGSEIDVSGEISVLSADEFDLTAQFTPSEDSRFSQVVWFTP